MTYLDTLLFGYYPYVALSVFLLASLVRFDREQYSWKTDSSQLLRAGQLRWASNLFHIGVLFLFFGHFFGLLTPHAVYEHFVTPADKQLGAMISGGIAGLAAFIGITMLLHRRLTDPRILANSRSADIFIAVLLWLQLFLGLISIAVSAQHLDGSLMMAFGEWAQRIVTFRAGRLCDPLLPGGAQPAHLGRAVRAVAGKAGTEPDPSADGPASELEAELLEALRLQAVALGLLPVCLTTEDDPAAVRAAVERLLADELRPAVPSEDECRRYYEAHRAEFVIGARVRARHILFGVTPGVPVDALRSKAEQVLHQLRADPTGFGGQARELSNCPGGASGGALGRLAATECAPEFAEAIFGRDELGVLPRLVLSRHGLHIVEVLERAPGEIPGYGEVRERVAAIMARRAYLNEARRYLTSVVR
ncbi:MAG: respiratory nitrate reductase subunit gamma [Burkholderiaceae bacterium]|nr:respiratory nitrate reductase subunit gamma [Burkholderiaceae bacterium]